MTDITSELDTTPCRVYIHSVFPSTMPAVRKSVLLLIACVWALAAHSDKIDGPEGRDAMAKAACAMFQSGDYARLEQTADDLRKTKVSLAFAPDGKTLVPGAADGAIKWWDASTRRIP